MMNIVVKMDCPNDRNWIDILKKVLVELNCGKFLENEYTKKN